MFLFWASLVAQLVNNLLAMQETQVRFLGQENPVEKEMATHSSILAWRSPWTEEPGGLHSIGSQELDRTVTEHAWACMNVSSTRLANLFLPFPPFFFSFWSFLPSFLLLWSGHPRWLFSCSLYIPFSTSPCLTYTLLTWLNFLRAFLPSAHLVTVLIFRSEYLHCDSFTKRY